MLDYDFSTLNDKEFENISIDLLSKNNGLRYERFKVGRDGGIDGRYYNNGNSEIIQCKHYLKTGWDGLIRSLKKKNSKGINEIGKVEKLKPSKYIFVTSLPLSVKNKETIKELFEPYIKSDDDIYGQEDLNVILSEYPNIEKKYYKLWLTSTVILDKLINNGIENSSEFLKEDINEKTKYYVETENHHKALEKLETSNVIIIAGEPGIGKTTLGEHLALTYIEKDFKFYNIEESLTDAFAVIKRDENQIFFYDDFLGANYLKAIDNKNDSAINRFIKIIKNSKNKKFILTSRTNILNKGYNFSDTHKSANLRNNEFMITINSLRDIDKAKILYNHIWHGSLSEELIDEIYIDKRYKYIIKHKNFNPRLVDFITDIEKLKYENIMPTDFWTYIKNKLDNPQDIWKNTFDEESNVYIRILVFLTVFNGNKIDEVDLRDSYMEYIKLSKTNNNANENNEFKNIVMIVIKYFLNKNIYDHKTEYSLFNPSIADFIIDKYKYELEILKNIFLSLNTDKSLNSLNELFSNKLIGKKEYLNILVNLFEENYHINNYKLLIDIVLCIIENKILIKDFERKLKNILDVTIKSELINLNTLKLLNYSIKKYNYSYDLKKYLDESSLEQLDEFVEIGKSYENLNLQDKTLIDYKNNLDFELIDAICEDLKQIVYSEVSPYEYIDIDDEGYESYDIVQFNVRVRELLWDIFPEKYMKLFDIKEEEVLKYIDLGDLEIYNYKSSKHDYHPIPEKNIDKTSNIDDLFER
ncbi:nSTAND3 domain-containing NTPase [Poseidonibacter lekithochrous]|uniref:nSTAND3 domain-containing NTPase n=1 Tax=Poseidonibacter lekithochrous TaxID=1904463 RepID=UPI000D354C54|nr:restriction endonuclease [Poseidonibacter lekithochrous]